jgi:hypothetical protein
MKPKPDGLNRYATFRQGFATPLRCASETVANLAPTERHKNADAETTVAQMKKFMLEVQVKGVDIQALIREGRA